jgi:pyruvate/2-oxoacid:ferredoxin oxidoreductase alpha subunit
VLAPDSAQEMCDLTLLAFELADRYRNPAVVLADGYIGQMMEPVAFPDRAVLPAIPDYAVSGTGASRSNLVSSIYLEPDELERHVRKLEAKYQRSEQEDVRFEERETADADLVVVGYGIVGRVLKEAVEAGRAEGLHLGLLRPITLYPFPHARIRELARHVSKFAVVELSTGQLVDDVRLALEGRRPVEFYSRVGGNVPSTEEVLGFVRETVLREVVHA